MALVGMGGASAAKDPLWFMPDETTSGRPVSGQCLRERMVRGYLAG